jgi:uridine phosphorylase
VAANHDSSFEIVTGKTVAGNEFFLEQFRLDGAVCMETPQTKLAWLEWIYDNGVRNIEMEGAMLAGYLNHWGFSKFAMICATLLNRLDGDQVTASADQMHQFSADSGSALFTYLRSTLL